MLYKEYLVCRRFGCTFSSVKSTEITSCCKIGWIIFWNWILSFIPSQFVFKKYFWFFVVILTKCTRWHTMFSSSHSAIFRILKLRPKVLSSSFEYEDGSMSSILSHYKIWLKNSYGCFFIIEFISTYAPSEIFNPILLFCLTFWLVF